MLVEGGDFAHRFALRCGTLEANNSGPPPVTGDRLEQLASGLIR